MKEKIEALGRVESLSFPKTGHVRLENDARVSVKCVLPGQTVRVSISPRKKREGRLLEVVEPAPYEVPAACPHADICGGCAYQTVPYEQQLQWKDGFLDELLKPVFEAYPEATGACVREPICPSPLPLGYRNKMEFSFGDAEKGGPLMLGLHKKNSFHDIVPVSECRLVSPSVNAILTYTQDFFRTAGVPFYNTYSGEGILRHLVVRRGFERGELMLNLVTRSGYTLPASWLSGLLALPLEERVVSVFHTVNDALADVVQADSCTLLYGQPHLTEALLGLSFEISPFSFFQTNSLGAEKLYSIVRDFAGDVSGKTLFDLYCGTGTIAQILAAAGAGQVFGIELVEEAVDAAHVNAEANGLENVSFIAGDVFQKVDELANLELRPDLIVLDPPRDGIHPKALPKLLAFAPQEFIYVSCKPTSLVRDLPAFFEAGYQLKRLRCCDMFPQTPGVETVCLLINQNAQARHHVNVGIDAEDYYIIKSETQAEGKL